MRLLLILIIFNISACRPVIYLVYGAHKPKQLSNDQMLKHYSKLGYSNYSINMLDSLTYRAFLKSDTQISVNRLFIFDSLGRLLKNDVIDGCVKDGNNYLASMCNGSLNKIDTSFTLNLFNGMDKQLNLGKFLILELKIKNIRWS